jgi:hypothetical protein
MWIHPETLRIFKLHSDIRSAFPNVSFPRVMTDSMLESFGVLRVEQVPAPEFDLIAQTLTPGELVQQDGNWAQTWNVTDATTEEVEQRTEQQAAQVRAERNALLAASDWTQLADSTVDKAAWAAYRQALRDISGQEGFPWTIVWPKAPTE